MRANSCEHQSGILSPCLFSLYVDYIMRNARLDEVQAGIKIAGRNINNLRYADGTTLMAESKEALELESQDWGGTRGNIKLGKAPGSQLGREHIGKEGYGVRVNHGMAQGCEQPALRSSGVRGCDRQAGKKLATHRPQHDSSESDLMS